MARKTRVKRNLKNIRRSKSSKNYGNIHNTRKGCNKGKNNKKNEKCMNRVKKSKATTQIRRSARLAIKNSGINDLFSLVDDSSTHPSKPSRDVNKSSVKQMNKAKSPLKSVSLSPRRTKNNKTQMKNKSKFINDENNFDNVKNDILHGDESIKDCSDSRRNQFSKSKASRLRSYINNSTDSDSSISEDNISDRSSDASSSYNIKNKLSNRRYSPKQSEFNNTDDFPSKRKYGKLPTASKIRAKKTNSKISKTTYKRRRVSSISSRSSNSDNDTPPPRRRHYNLPYKNNKSSKSNFRNSHCNVSSSEHLKSRTIPIDRSLLILPRSKSKVQLSVRNVSRGRSISLDSNLSNIQDADKLQKDVDSSKIQIRNSNPYSNENNLVHDAKKSRVVNKTSESVPQKFMNRTFDNEQAEKFASFAYDHITKMRRLSMERRQQREKAVEPEDELNLERNSVNDISTEKQLYQQQQYECKRKQLALENCQELLDHQYEQLKLRQKRQVDQIKQKVQRDQWIQQQRDQEKQYQQQKRNLQLEKQKLTNEESKSYLDWENKVSLKNKSSTMSVKSMKTQLTFDRGHSYLECKCGQTIHLKMESECGDSTICTNSECGQSSLDDSLVDMNNITRNSINSEVSSTTTDEGRGDTPLDFRTSIANLVNPCSSLSTSSLDYIDSMMKDIMHRLALTARNVKYGKSVMTHEEISQAVNIVLPQRMAKGANEFASKALNN